ncbi:MAG: Transcriptional regulator, TetR family [uncultured Campylobacterales bacterium]|uniref:Transcriptional regulator, TetR family n=1 Tax=uncultured Campylobacterales bacterium TaxID=352960 RepID=A0A6S6S1D6_9BACT|nr:MAG: Transcriptional regulator, TetR family [uncultured Campylobacterales bacterium]
MELTTKEKIIHSSLALFSEFGYHATGVRKIAKDVGIRESAIYNHFKNKEDILTHIIDKYFDSTFLLKDNINLNIDKPKSTLLDIAMSFKLLSYDKNSDKFFRFFIIEIMQNKNVRDKYLDNYLEKQINALSSLFFEMMQKGLIGSSDPISLAWEFLSSLFFYRFQISVFNIDRFQSSNTIASSFEKHISIFWNSIKNSN